jgi:hypothetical protein
MTLLLERPPKDQPPMSSARSLFGAGDRGRSIQVGLVLALIVWCGLLFLFGLAARHLGGGDHAATGQFSLPVKPAFDIEIAPDQFILPEKTPPPPDRFVETNPDAPENTPDKTRNFGAQNQQVAQEKPTPDGKSDTPATEGKKDHESNQIVSGELTTSLDLPPPPTAPPSPEIMEALAAAQAQREQNPLAGTEKNTGDSTTGYGFNIAKPGTKPSDAPEKVEGLPDAPVIIGAPQMTQPRIDPSRPQPRPRINTRARPAVLADNRFGTDNIGPVAFDARWSQYGQYLQQLIETVQVQWERLLIDSRAYPPPGSQCMVKFRLHRDGSVGEIVSSEGNGGRQFEQICIAGITTRAPYGKWTDDMVAVLGESTELTFTFYIQ